MGASTTPYKPLLSEDEYSAEDDNAPPVIYNLYVCMYASRLLMPMYKQMQWGNNRGNSKD